MAEVVNEGLLDKLKTAIRTSTAPAKARGKYQKLDQGFKIVNIHVISINKKRETQRNLWQKLL